MPKVLVIDDDPQIRDIYAQEFSRLQFEVENAINGLEGIKAIKENMPDIVLLDLIMPEKSGFEVLEAVKSDPNIKHIPILVLTNILADFEDLVKQGAADCLLKVDQTPGDIAEKVKRILTQKGKIQEEMHSDNSQNNEINVLREEIDLSKPSE